MSLIYYDFETRSGLKLNEVQAMKYLHTPESDIVCMSYRIGIDSPTLLWIPNNPSTPLPNEFKNPKGYTFYAFNSQFEYLVHNILGKRYGFGPITLSQCCDIAALCSRYGYPHSLAAACVALNVTNKKLSSGKELITKICEPPFKYTKEDMIEFLKYAIRDTDAMCEVVKALPASRLSDEEQTIWELTAKINLNGLPVDINNVTRINSIVKNYVADQTKAISDITNGELYSINQTVAIPAWVRKQGVNMFDLQADTVDDLLKENIPNNVKKLLELRQLIGKNSIKKYDSLQLQYHRGRIFNNLRYYGGHTGRFAGIGFQVHNLPRAKVKDVEGAIQKFWDLSILNNGERPVDIAKALIRPMIKAVDGTLLLVADYKTIEFRLLMWIVGHFDVLDKVKRGEDVYVEFAANQLYHIPIEEVTDYQRQIGKVTVLGAGYYLGATTLIPQAKSYGIDLTYDEAQQCITAFRSTYNKVPPMWHSVKRCALDAIIEPGKEFNTHKCIFKVVYCRNDQAWLTIKLPSGRVMYYADPIIEDGDFGPTPSHLGANQKTGKLVRLQLPPNRLTENIIQALARDILMYGERLIDNNTPYPILASVHDENIIEVPDDGNNDVHWNKVEKCMTIPPPWCSDLPLAVSGYVERRYRKD